MVSGPCSLTTSKMARAMDRVCSGGGGSSIGAILGFPAFAAYRAAVANISAYPVTGRARLSSVC
jgi:hypothetical protein